MLIWDIIRDWFVMNIWGGNTSNYQYYSPTWGNILDADGNGAVAHADDLFVNIGSHWSFSNDFDAYDVGMTMSLGDWLSTTSTILVLVAVCVGLFYLTRYFFRMFAGLLSGR